MRFGWTVASLLVAGLVIGFFIYTIANFLSYGFAAMYNVTAMVEEASASITNTSNVTVKTVKIGNYTAEVAEPSDDALKGMFASVFPIVHGMVKALTDPRVLAVVIAVTFIMVAVSTNTSGVGEW